MKLGMVGLGRMGGNMSIRLVRGGHEVVVSSRNPESVSRIVEEGAVGSDSLEDLVSKLDPPRIVWIMLPSGEVTEQTLIELSELLDEGDVVVDGGNSHYKDSQRRAADLAESGIRMLDAGTSGGIWGLDNGYCLMVGGERAAYDVVEPALASLAPAGGLMHTGPSGSGHFVKMVHNGIEYGLLAAYGEGFEILKSASDFPELDLTEIAGIWGYGSVVRSWLLELLRDALEKDPGLESVRGYVDDSGEGRWTVQAAIDENVPAPFTALALFARFASRQEESFAAQAIAALRNEFGGHAVKKEGA